MTDATSGNAMSGANITYTVGNGTKQTAQTGDGGTFALGSLKVGTRVTIKVQKPFYDDNTERIVVGGSCGSPIDIPLNPRSTDGRIVLTWASDSPRDLDLHMRSQVNLHYDTK